MMELENNKVSGGEAMGCEAAASSRQTVE